MEPVHIIDVAPASPVPVRAAQYVRMSTEHQQYSTLNQKDVLGTYAAARGIDIVRTYADEGKSGLRLDGRPALRQLIQDVVSGDAPFSIILVYDVSRWGRFQDADESAHYEFLCRQAGINVEYCAEQFANDGSPVGALLKGMKRIMAAEYSRELSAKVHFAQSRVARLGYVVGGSAGLGFRRLVLDQFGNPRGILERGEHKAVTTDRVILVPGPPKEVALVRWMYEECASGKSIQSIATRLNDRGVLTPRGHRWLNATIASLLRNEKYVGNNIWNRKSYKLRKNLIHNPKSDWIRVDGAFRPIVDRELFDQAQHMVAKRKEPRSDQEVLDALERLLAKKGRLTREIVRADRHTPNPSSYDVRFGGLTEAYRRIGYTPERNYSSYRAYRYFRKIAKSHAVEAAERIRATGKTVSFKFIKWSITVDSELSILFMVLRYMKPLSGPAYWQIVPRTCADLVVASRMKKGNRHVLDHFLIPRDALTATSVRLHPDSPYPFESYRCDTLEPLYIMLASDDLQGAPMRDRVLAAIAAAARARPWWRHDGAPARPQATSSKPRWRR